LLRAAFRRWLYVRRRIFSGVHIHSFGNDGLWFRPYGESLFQTPKRNQKALPLTYGPSPRLRVPSLRSCSVGPPRSAIPGRARLTRHPCRVAHCAEPPLGLPTGQIKIKIKIKSQSEAACQPTCLYDRTHSPVGAGLLAMDVNDDAGCLNERVAQTIFAGKPAPTVDRCHARVSDSHDDAAGALWLI